MYILLIFIYSSCDDNIWMSAKISSLDVRIFFRINFGNVKMANKTTYVILNIILRVFIQTKNSILLIKINLVQKFKFAPFSTNVFNWNECATKINVFRFWFYIKLQCTEACSCRQCFKFTRNRVLFNVFSKFIIKMTEI